MEPAGQVRIAGSDVATRLGLGTAPIGNLFTPVEPDQARATVERAWHLGIRLFDTAPLYGHGLAEQRLGKALAGRPRDDYVLSTKVGRLLQARANDVQAASIFAATPPADPVFDFSADATLRSLEESLDRLGLDRVDILYVHDPDEHFDEALRGALPVLLELRAQGVIGGVGVGMNQAEMLARFVREADLDCLLLAGRYTLLDQTAAHDLLPLCEQRGVSVIVGGVYNSGILATPVPGATYDYAPAHERLLARARRLERVCAAHGVPLKAASIQFPYGHAAVASVVSGSRSPAELEDNVAMLRYPVPAALWADLRSEGLIDERAPVPVPAAAE